jgi:hypothetical protein
LGALAATVVALGADMLAPGLGTALLAPLLAAGVFGGYYLGGEIHRRKLKGSPADRFGARLDELEQSYVMESKFASKAPTDEEAHAMRQRAFERRRRRLTALELDYDRERREFTRPLALPSSGVDRRDLVATTHPGRTQGDDASVGG